MENGVFIQNENTSGWRGRRSGRGGGGRNYTDPDPFDDESTDDDAMEVDENVVNPNDF